MAQANVVAKVALVVGQAYAKSSDGSMRKLAVGDVIREGEQIVTSQGGRVELAFDDGTIRLARVNEPVHPDSFATAPNDGDQRPAELAGGDSQRVIDALAQGRNLDDLLEDPAAGLRTGGGRSDGGHAFVRIDRIVEPVTPLSFEFGTFERAAEFPVGGLATALLVDRNSAPDAIPDTNAVTERVDSAVPSTTSGNVLTTAPHGAGFTDQADSDPEGDALTVTQAQFGTGPAVVAGTPMTLAYGTLTLNSDGTYTYSVDNANPTVNALNVGGILTEVVTYTVSDGNGGTATTTLTITINGANDSPTAIVGAPIVIPEDSPGVVVPLRGTDPDSPLQSVTVTALPPASQGALVKPDGTPVVPGEPIPVGSDGTAQLTFVPAPNFNGTVNVPFIVTDDQGAPSPGAVQQITVTPVNDAPVANNDSASTPNGQPVTINVLGNDSDPDGDPLAIVGTPTAPNGTVTVNPDGTLTYRPNPGFSGTETFTYTVTDPGGATSTATVTVNVAPPVNLPPVAQPDSATTSANTPVSGNVLTNDSDPENNPLTVTGFAVDTDGDGVRESFAPGQTATIAGIGTLTIGSTGAFTFSPAPDYSGPVPVANYSVTDGSGSASSTLTLGISAVPLPPQVGNVSSPTVTEGGNLDFVVTIANPSASPTTATLALAGGTATLGTDTDPPQVSFDGGVTFAPLTTPDVTLPAGATSLIVRVPTAADAINEPTETLTLSASTPANTVPVVGTGSILDNSGQPTLSIDDVTVNEGAGTATFTVTLSATSGQTVTVGYDTSNGTATEGADYTAASGTLSFAPGETSKTITVPILNDATYEGAETFNVILVAPVNAGILDDVGLGTIVDDGTGFVPPGLTPDDDRPAVASVSSPTVTEGAPLDFTVSLTHPSTTPTAVTLSPASGTATLGTDTDPAQVSFDGGASFVPVVGSTVTVPAGVTDFIVRFPTVDDAISEPNETMTLGAATAQNASPVSGTGTINDNDGAPQLSISGPADVNEAAGTISYTVSLTNASASPVTVNYATADGTATAGADYTASTGTLTFAPGETSKTITVPITNDATYEGAETYSVGLSAPIGATIASGSVTTTIHDDGTGFVPPGVTPDDDRPAVASVSSPTVTEGAPLDFTVSLTHPSTTPTAVTLSPASGTATLGTDTDPAQVSFDGGASFVPVVGSTVTVPAGVTDFIVRFPTVDDAISEPNETMTLGAATAQNASPVSGTGTINDNDGAPQLSISGPADVNEAAGTISYTVSLTNASASPVTVNYATADGTATAGADYTASTGTLTFAPGETSKTITVPITNDATYEGAETYSVGLSAPTGATIATGSVTTTIHDDGTGFVPPGVTPDDDRPAVASVSSPTVTEGAPLDFTVSLTHPSTTPTAVTLSPASGTATLGTDTDPAQVSFDGGASFVPVVGSTVTVPAGVTDFIVRFPTVDDAISEPNETMTLGAATAQNASPVSGTGTINDNDGAPQLSISGPADVNEAAGTISYTVSLTNASASPVTVNYATADGTATAGADYTASTGTLTFAPGETSKTVTVNIVNDATYEGPETYTIGLSAPTGASIASGSVSTTIHDDGTGFVPPGVTPDDDRPAVASVSSPTVTEGAPLDFTVSLTHPSTTPTAVTLSPASGTATLGTDTDPAQVSFDGGASFVPVVGSTVTVPAGVTDFIVRFPTVDDAISEPNETMTLGAATAQNASPVSGTGTINDNDGAPQLSISGPVDVNEAAGTLTYTVSLTNASASPVTVNYATADGTATAGADYTASTGTLTFAPGETSKTVTVNIVNDATYEGPETYTIGLSAPTGATIATGSVTTTIHDDGTGFVPPGVTPDDDRPAVASVSSPTVTEGAPLDFTVSLTHPSTTPTAVTLSPASGTATLGTDTDPAQVSFDGGASFVPVVGSTVTVPAGVTDFIVRFPTVDDAISEPNETMTLGAATAQNASPVSGTGTINDNDGAPQLSISGPADVNEAAGTISYTVSLTNASASPVTVNYATADGTATAGADYTASTGTLTFAPGETSKTITVPITNDATYEGAETYSVGLSAPIGATIASGSVTTTIHDDGTGFVPPGVTPDDDRPAVASVSSPTVTEGAPLDFTVSLTHPSTTPTAVTLSPASGTATLGTDTDPAQVSFDGGASFVPVVGSTVTVPAGVTDFIVRFPTVDDAISEPNETMTLGAATAQNASPVSGTGTINDNDGAPQLSISGPADVNEAAGTISYTVSLTNASASPVTVNYATADGTATAGADYTASTGTLTFAPGETSKTITVPITNDATYEGAETYSVGLSAPIGATIATGSVTTTIHDDGTGFVPPGVTPDDDRPAVASVSSPTVTEGAPLDFTVSLTHPSTTPTAVTLSPASGTATLGTDTDPAQVSFDGGASFVPVVGSTVTVPAGVTDFIVRFPTVDDAISEPNETMTLGAATAQNASPVSGTGTINDNDGAPQLSISGPADVNEAAGTISYTVSLTNASASPVTVNYATADGTATAGADYTASTGTLTFAPGETSKTITVPITNDATYEGAETYSVGLSAPTGATIATGSVTTTIHDDGTGFVPPGVTPDDDRPAVASVSSPTVTEGAPLDFTVSLTHPSTTPTAVTLSPASGTATLGTDTDPAQVSFDGGASFVPVVGSTVTVPAGVTDFIVRFPTVDDAISEPNETMTLGAATAQNASPVSGTGTINDNDGAPQLSISGPADVNEAAGTISYTVSLTNASASPVTVNYATADGTATAGADYTASTGTLTFAPGETSKTITVPITNDATYEGAETYSVGLSAPIGATIATGSVTTTIHDDGTGFVPPGVTPDDDRPAVASVSSPTVTEGAPLDFTVSLTHPSTTPTAVTLSPASGTATLGTDTDPAQVSFDGGASFVPVVGSTVTVPAGVTDFIVRFPTVDDAISEPNETMTLGAATAQNASPVSGTGTINDNDGAPQLSISGPADVNEAAGTISYTVSLTNASASPVTVNYATADGTATAGADYTASTGTLTFAPGETSKTITVPITNDATYEGAETYSVGLSAPIGATIATGSVTTTIHDDGTGFVPPGVTPDDDRPAVASVSSPTVTEGAPLDFTVSLTHPSTTPTAVTLSPASGTATLGTDTDPAQVSFDGGASFVPVVGSTVTVPAGVTDFIVRFPTVDDAISEPNETMTLGAATAQNASPVSGTGTINDNDGAPQLSISGPVDVNEAAGTISYTVSLTNASASPVTVNYATADGTATAGADYTASTGTLTFAPGETSKTVTVNIVNDATYEGPETYTIGLSAPTGATIATGSVTTTIHDDGTGFVPPGVTPDDDRPAVASVSSPTVTEGAPLDFTVSLTHPSTTPTAVTLTPAGVTATLGTDTDPAQVSFDGGASFVPVVGSTVTVPAGVTDFIVRFPTVDDAISEPNETMTLGAATAQNASPVSGTGTITDNDGAPQLSISGPVDVNEAAGTLTYTVSLTNASASPVTVNYATADGTATAGADYTAASGTLSFAPGETSKTVTVNIVNDATYEGPETYTIGLSAPTGASIASGSVSTTIHDDGTGFVPPGVTPDDDRPAVASVSSPTVTEGAPLDFTVSLTHPSTTPTAVTLTPAGVTATLGTDTDPAQVSFDGGASFVPVVGSTVTVPAGVTDFIVRFPTVDDAISEPNETMTLGAATAQNASPVSGTGTINDNDGAPQLSISGPVDVNEAAGTLTYTVSLTNASASPVTVNYATADGTATAGADYTAASGTLTFAPGETSKTVTVNIVNDATYEGPETYTIGLSAPTGATIATGSVTTTIHDDGTGFVPPGVTPDDDRPAVASVSSPTVTEGAPLDFTVSLTHPSTTPTAVTLSPASGTATLGTDTDPAQVSFDGGASFVPVVGSTVTVPAGVTDFIVRFPTVDDAISEPNETMTLGAATAQNASPVSGTGTITDNDGAPQLSISGPVDVNEAAGTISYTVSLTNASASPVTVNYATADGTATAGADYTASTGTLTFAPGETSKTITVPITNDATYEGAETYSVGLSAPIGATIATGSVTTTIHDDGTGFVPPGVTPDDDRPAVASVSSPTVTEGAPLDFTVSLTHPSTTPTAVTLSPASGTATLGTDTDPAQVSFDGGASFVPVVGSTVTVPAGVTDFIVRFPTVDDAISEPNETMTLGAATAQNASPVSGTGTINDNDGAPQLSISGPADVNEAAGTISYTVSLTNASASPVTVNYATADGTATAGADYTASTGTLTFAPGETSKTITVPITNDATYEGAETYSVGLSAPTGATIATGSVTTTIHDDGTGFVPPGVTPDDDRPAVASVSSPTVTEGAPLDFTVSLTHPSTTPTAVTLSPASGTATLGTDTDPAQVSFDGGASFVPVVGSTVTVPAGVTDFIVRFPTVDDAISEPNETMTLGAATAQNASPVSGTGTINDNDGAPQLSISGPADVNEAAGTISYTVSLTNASASPVTVNYATADGTATAGADYTASTGTLTFAPGETSKTITVPITNDATYEGAETYSVGLSAPTGATIATGSVTTTIHDDGTGFVPPGVTPDNDTPTLSVSSTTVQESAGFAVFTVSLSNPSTAATTVSLATANGTATSPADYGTALQVSTDNGATWSAAGAASATFAPGATSVLVRAPIVDDAINEPTETFTLTATRTAGSTTNPSATGTGTITDNDALPSLSINDVTVNEAAGTATFTVSLSGVSGQAVTVGYNTSNGTATAGADYTSTSGTLSFAPGVTTQTITVPITNDNVFEGAETFNVNLVTPTNATIADNLGVGTIRDDGTGFVPPGVTPDNDTPTLSVSSTTVQESAGFAVFTVSLSNPSTAATTVSLATANGTATSPADYGTALQVSTDNGATWSAAGAASATFAPGATSVLVRAPIVDDAINEPTETFTLTATRTAGSTTNPSATGTGTITDNDALPSLSINDVTVNEAAGTATFTVSLSGVSGQAVTVGYNTSNGTATAGADYTSTSGTLSFAPGVTTQTITVPITNDNVFEGAETFNVNLVTPTNATIADNLGVGTIRDDGTGFVPPGVTPDNDTPTLSVSSTTVQESAGFAVFTVSLSNPSTAATTVSLATANGTATSPADYGTALQVSTDNGATWSAAGAASATFAPGATSVLVRAPIVDDAINEPTETFTLTATRTAGSTTNPSATGTGTITDNDALPSLSINDVTVNEAAGTATFTVSLSGVSGQAVTVGYNTSNGTATAGADYTSTSGTLSFAPGVTTQTITVPITNDNVFEGAETFNVNLVTPTNATIADNLGVGTIRDDGTGFVPPGVTPDNDTPTLSVSSTTVQESAGFAVFTVSLSNPSTAATTVSLATANGTATSPADYGTALQVSTDNGATWSAAGAASATFAPGATSVLVRAPIVDDAINEPTETFTLTATRTAGSTTNPSATGTGTITDNDALPSLSINDVTVNEAAGTATFTVSLSGVSGQAVTVGYNTSNGTATAGADYTSTSGTLSFAPGVTTQTITVPITNDNVFEGAETFNVNLVTPTNATIADNLGVGTIRDDGTGFVPPGVTPDNDTPTLSVSSTTVQESAGFAVFTVSLSNPSTAATTVSLATANGTATSPADYGTALQVSTDNGATWSAAGAASATFAPGATSVLVRAPIVDDAINEPTETFTLTATRTAGSTTNPSATGTGTILDNDAAPTASPVPQTGTEDTPLSLNWAAFGAADADTPAANLSVRITSLPLDGILRLNGVAVTTGQLISKANIDAGQLVFSPDANESGYNGFPTAGTGNLRQDYASFNYQVSDGANNSSTATLRIDINPVADQPNLTVANAGATTLFANSWESAPNSDTTSEPVSGATFEGWTLITAPDSQSGGVNAFEVWAQGDFQQRQDGGFAAVLPNPGTGSQYLELNNVSGGGTLPQTLGISRSISTVAGSVYDFSFEYAGREGFGTTYTQIGIYVDGVLAAQYSATSPQDYIDWKQLHYSIVGDGGTHAISIRTDATQFTSGGRGAFVDELSMTSYQGVIAGNAGGG